MKEIPALEPSDLECLDRLVEKGEMLMPKHFTNLCTLIAVGYAEIVDANWHGVALVMPTDKGKEVVLWRKHRTIISVHKKA